MKIDNKDEHQKDHDKDKYYVIKEVLIAEIEFRKYHAHKEGKLMKNNLVHG